MDALGFQYVCCTILAGAFCWLLENEEKCADIFVKQSILVCVMTGTDDYCHEHDLGNKPLVFAIIVRSLLIGGEVVFVVSFCDVKLLLVNMYSFCHVHKGARF